MNSKILLTGSYLPEKTYDNFYFEKIVDTSDEWINERTGIKKRHIADDSEQTSDLAFKACCKMLDDNNFDRSLVDTIIFATTTPDRVFPSCATILQNKLCINDRCFSFDIQAVCCGFIYALDMADSLIKSGKSKNVLVVGAETMTKIINWEDRGTCILFGDGAGCLLLQATNENDKGILSTTLHSDGSYFDILKTSGGPSYNKQVGHIEMEGKEVFKLAVNKMSSCVIESLNKVNLNTSDIDLLIPHQANQRIISAVGDKLELDSNKVISVISEHANTSSASVPLALDYAVKNGRIKNNDILVLEALGAGLTWGSAVIRW